MVRREPPKLKTAGSSPVGDAFFFASSPTILAAKAALTTSSQQND